MENKDKQEKYIEAIVCPYCDAKVELFKQPRRKTVLCLNCQSELDLMTFISDLFLSMKVKIFKE